jgi:hypothetical protein
MTSSVKTVTSDIRVLDVMVTDHELTVALMDGRTIAVPLAWYPRLAQATPAQRLNWETAGAGYGTEGLLSGRPAPSGSEVWRSPFMAKA